jgi:hypothetical protein
MMHGWVYRLFQGTHSLSISSNKHQASKREKTLKIKKLKGEACKRVLAPKQYSFRVLLSAA